MSLPCPHIRPNVVISTIASSLMVTVVINLDRAFACTFDSHLVRTLDTRVPIYCGERITTFFCWAEKLKLFENRSVRWLIAYSTCTLIWIMYMYTCIYMGLKQLL